MSVFGDGGWGMGDGESKVTRQDIALCETEETLMKTVPLKHNTVQYIKRRQLATLHGKRLEWHDDGYCTAGVCLFDDSNKKLE